MSQARAKEPETHTDLWAFFVKEKMRKTRRKLESENRGVWIPIEALEPLARIRELCARLEDSYRD